MAAPGTTVLINGNLVTLRQGAPAMGAVANGAIAERDGRIAAVGPAGEIAAAFPDAAVRDLGGRLVTPGLVDCHTHLVHAGHRAREFEMRLAGRDYAEIAREGGGILSTVRATRAASDDSLAAQSQSRLDRLIAEGVTTVEIKSGYGLDLATELRILRVARRLGAACPVTVSTSYLGAHAVPPEFAGDPDGYVGFVVDEALPQVAAAGLADAVDGFCETIAFSPAQIASVFAAARRLDLKVRLHADQLSNLHGAALAAAHGALSADHLEFTDEDGVRAMARAGTVAVLLPGAFYFLGETRLPPVAALRRHGVAIAVATDCNPGSSPLTSPLLALNLAATQFRLTVEECLAGMTREGARALGLGRETGTIEPGKWCDLVIWDVEQPAELVYRMGWNPLWARVWRGRWTSASP